MTSETKEQQQKHRRDSGAAKPRDKESQGIVRDQRGQEQPTDKERAQQTSKND